MISVQGWAERGNALGVEAADALALFSNEKVRP